VGESVEGARVVGLKVVGLSVVGPCVRDSWINNASASQTTQHVSPKQAVSPTSRFWFSIPGFVQHNIDAVGKSVVGARVVGAKVVGESVVGARVVGASVNWRS